MKNLKAVILGLVATGSIFLGSNKVSVSAQEVTTASNESYKIEEQKEITYNDFKIIDTYVNSVNSTIIEFSDGSSAILNASQDLYEFYQTDLGDWGTKGDSREDLINIIKTYMELRFDMSEEQINNHDNFKNVNLVGHVETFEDEKEIIEVNEVVEEVQEEVKEVEKNEVNETIEKNENVEKVEVNEVIEVEEVQGDTTEEVEEVEDTTEEVIQDLQPIENDKTLEENIKEYIEYRNNLIEEYGEEVYNKMNEEAGITTEEESFLQFVEYGI